MKRMKHTAALGVLIVLAGAGCGQTADEPTEDYLGQDELVAFRGEVTRALGDIESEISQLQASIEPRVEESWTDLTTSTQTASAEMRADLDRLSTATAVEARSIQRAAAERLAELEADMTRNEISSATTADSLVARVTTRLNALESDIQAIAEGTAGPEDVRTPADMLSAREEASDLQERLGEIRADLIEVPMDDAEDSFVASREELGSEVAELTQEVRQKWYEGQWGIEG